MSDEFWAIIGMGSLILLAILKTNERLAEANRRLFALWEQRHNKY